MLNELFLNGILYYCHYSNSDSLFAFTYIDASITQIRKSVVLNLKCKEAAGLELELLPVSPGMLHFIFLALQRRGRASRWGGRGESW